MRELKFRAYIKEFNKIYQVMSLFDKIGDEDFYRVYINKVPEGDDVKNYRIDGVDNVLMQKIGECYEGDIVKYGGMIYEVRWVGAGFWLVNPEEKDVEITPTTAASLHILGNIYENPELLNNK